MSIIFDCDGVLVNSERLVCRIEADLLTSWGWPCTPQQHREAFKGRTFLELARAIEERLAGRLPVDWMYQWAMAQANGFRAELREVPGVREVIEGLLADGQALCVASQSPPGRVRLSLELCDLARYFGPRVFTASLVARPKPAPDLFLYAAAQLGVAPDRCNVIEDSPSGVRAAVAAGMRVFGYAADEDVERLASAGALTFTDMAELRALIQTPPR